MAEKHICLYYKHGKNSEVAKARGLLMKAGIEYLDIGPQAELNCEKNVMIESGNSKYFGIEGINLFVFMHRRRQERQSMPEGKLIRNAHLSEEKSAWYSA